LGGFVPREHRDVAVDLNHLHLGVDDIDRSRAFYEQFGFREHVWHGDTLFMRNDDGFDLALAPHGRGDMPPWFHVGCRLGSAAEVRALEHSLADRVHERGEEPDFVWFRVTDPDDYQLEIYWEP
jgi:catechol 2,3-dioxygenase-like lactoylglutathione lyase family enzyme